MKKIRNIKYILPFLMSAMVACTEKIYVEPPVKTFDIKTIDDLDALLSVNMDDTNTNFVANWKNTIALTPFQTDIIGKLKDLDEAKPNFTMNDNGYGISFDKNAILSRWLWFNSRYHNIVPNPYKPRVPLGEYSFFISKGETDILPNVFMIADKQR